MLLRRQPPAAADVRCSRRLHRCLAGGWREAKRSGPHRLGRPRLPPVTPVPAQPVVTRVPRDRHRRSIAVLYCIQATWESGSTHQGKGEYLHLQRSRCGPSRLSSSLLTTFFSRNK